ncbi:T9SS type A sorting domain-containing protein, partial [Elusimicrobiota bacterium]
GLKDYIDTSRIDINYDLGGWVPIENVSDDVTVHLVGASSSSDLHIAGKPLMVSFRYGSGKVLFTTFHNEAGLGASAKKILEYFVLISITTQMDDELANHMQDRGFLVEKENLDALDEDDLKAYKYRVPSELSDYNIAFGMNWDEPGTYLIEIYDPDGKLARKARTSDPPFIIELKGRGAGNWNYSVTAKDVPEDNYPMVIMVGQRQDSANKLSNVRVSPNPFIPETGHKVIVFDNLTEEAEFRIFSVSGELIAEFEKDNPGGYFFWDGKSNGDELGSGVYIYYITNDEGDYKKGKLGIIR